MEVFRLSLFVVLVGAAFPLLAQQADSTAAEGPQNPFRRGRWLAGISGSIGSTNIGEDLGNSDTSSFNNSHQVTLQIGYFVKDKVPVGAFVSSRSQNSSEILERESEVLFLGFWGRYYLAAESVGLYPELSIFYAHFFSRNSLLDDPLRRIDYTMKGGGAGLSLGLGFSYVLADLFMLDINLNYHAMRISGNFTDQIEQVTDRRSFPIQEALFSFGFKVLIR